MEFGNLGKWIIGIGIMITALGGLIWLLGQLGIPLGKLPGDIKMQKGNFFVYAPILSSILLSVLLTVIINVILWIVRKH